MSIYHINELKSLINIGPRGFQKLVGRLFYVNGFAKFEHGIWMTTKMDIKYVILLLVICGPGKTYILLEFPRKREYFIS